LVKELRRQYLDSAVIEITPVSAPPSSARRVKIA